MKVFLNIVYALNILAALLLFTSYLAYYINPNLISIPSFLALAYPLLLVVNGLFLIFWLIVKIRRIWLTLIIILLGFGHMGHMYQISGKKDKTKHTSFKVMSYNVQLFGLYDWHNNTEHRGKIFNVLRSEQPDILCLQEYYMNKSGYFPTSDSLLSFLDAKNMHQDFSASPDENQNFGMATFSSFPIIARGVIQFDNSYNMCLFSDIAIASDTFRVYNVHLQSIYFTREILQDINETSLTKIDKTKISEFKSVYRKLRRGFRQRAGQAVLVGEHIRKSPYPVIVCGDFNDTPNSFAYHEIAKGLKDSFKESGKGFGHSLEKGVLRMRIDHILHSSDIKAYGHHNLKNDYSDHYPVITYMQIK